MWEDRANLIPLKKNPCSFIGALLLKRLFEINYLQGKSVTEPLAQIEKVKLVKYKVKFSEREERQQVIPKVTTISPNQQHYFTMIGLKNPSNLELFLW